ncbi:MAG: superoxide dismutase family protein, partial [Nitrospinota bacterium]
SFDGKSAGGHFNPLKKRHGGPNAASHHAGDLGNVETNAFGVVNFKRQYKGITISSGPTSIAGRAVILHILPDDLKSQPTGAAGDRIACGVIGIVQD